MRFASSLVGILFLLGVCGCKTVEGMMEDLNSHRSTVQKATEDVAQPVENSSDYTGALVNLKTLILYQNVSPIYVTVEPISDQSASGGKLPAQVSMMVETAINKLGCSNIQLIPYTDVALGRKRDRPVFSIHGAITEYDADYQNTSNGASAGAFFDFGKTEGDASAEKEGGMSISSLSIDFSLNDMMKNIYVPGLHVSNNMKLIKATSSMGGGFSVHGTGLNLNQSITFKTGEHKALRLLVELSMVELIGRYFNLPYWVCIYDSDEVDNALLDNLVRNFTQAQPIEQGMKLQELLNYVTDGRMKIDGIIGTQTKAKIRRYAKSQQIDYKDYVAIYRQLILDSSSKFRQMRESQL